MNRCFYTVIWKCEKDNLASITLEFQIFFISTVPKSMVALLSVYDTMYCVKYYEIPPFFKRQKNPSIDLLNLFWHVTTDKRAHQCSHYTPPIHQYTSKRSAIALDMTHFNIFLPSVQWWTITSFAPGWFQKDGYERWRSHNSGCQSPSVHLKKGCDRFL